MRRSLAHASGAAMARVRVEFPGPRPARTRPPAATARHRARHRLLARCDLGEILRIYRGALKRRG
ncbi:hypothetical protein EAH76_21310 [Sphingomonas glacialis]|uniref:Uncharacterized protein n=1 Tax=Sphingomonas glacialis TaxID=658225 RepID=A0A502FFV9_9SPHN|nr:hypothetical protein EAH76_21310 [Sphingomonas glacialis]